MSEQTSRIKLKYSPKEKEGLAYRLLPGEERRGQTRAQAWLNWSILPARGSNKKGTVVLLHGVASNGSRWEEFAETTALREDWDIIRMDLRGHAASVCSRKARLEDWSADLEAILNAAGIARAVVIGHSLGAQIAMHFAAYYPNRLLALVLLDPLVSDALTPKAKGMRRKVPVLRVAEAVTRAMNSLGFVRRIVPQDLRAMDEEARVKIAKGGEELQAFIRQYSSAKADLQYIHLAPYLRDLVEVGRATPKASLITSPTLVIGSSAGTFTEEKAMARWVETLPHGTMRAVQCAHWPMTECPQEVARVIEEWVVATL
ncbi:MAG: alpha/beta fold hydrolase [Duodenibacillus sp.]